MTVRGIAEKLDLQVLTEEAELDREVTGGYASDLLSDVIAHAQAGNLWVTLQTHANILAVATLKELAAIVLVNGRRPDGEVLARARLEKVALLGTSLTAFELVGRLYQMGVRGGG
jgi:hypothetical protein